MEGVPIDPPQSGDADTTVQRRTDPVLPGDSAGTRGTVDIEIVELLPASRDDLVSMSINEGGVVAQVAAQAEAMGAYDFNSIKMMSRNLQQINEAPAH